VYIYDEIFKKVVNVNVISKYYNFKEKLLYSTNCLLNFRKIFKSIYV